MVETQVVTVPVASQILPTRETARRERAATVAAIRAMATRVPHRRHRPRGRLRVELRVMVYLRLSRQG